MIGGTTGTAPTITGTGAPGSTVDVSIGGKTVTTTVDPNGVWEATFDPNDLPADGVYPAEVHVVDPSGNTFDLSGPTVDVDTTPPAVDVTDGAVSSGDYVNDANHAGGAVISGTGEAGATVEVTIDGTTHSTTVDASGAWSVIFANAEIQSGEYTTSMTIVSTDARGNSTTITDSLQVDTVAPISAIQAVEGDNVVNIAEASDGVTLNGVGEAGSTITIDFQGISRSATVDANGNWSMDFAAGEIQGGTYDSTITVTSTDAFGNASSFDHTIHIDTEQSLTLDASTGGDHTINAAEQSTGVTFTGTAEAESTVDVTMGNITHQVVTAANET